MNSTRDKNIEAHSTMPEKFPLNWACDWGEDRFHGLWMAFEFKDVRHCFRWIKPSRFMMGSPAGELERYDDEPLHEVILTKGFWLGETTCTQELWEAVMGDNPSEFKGKKRPVETVSWDDCMGFIQKINSMMPGLDLRLPTEAEWEYACRAGTDTPFSFGNNITPVQVNYDGENPYAGGSEGEYREKTVETRSLPCNGWGLYEMHGNVWECCSDWYGEYETGRVIDPAGPDTGTDRVLRGGGWIDVGRGVRSAVRSRDGPGIRGDYVGFRLARGL